MSQTSALKPFPQPGEMPRLVRDFDWSSTELGRPADWPPELRASVDLMLDCQIPMMLGWGPDLRLIYNDGYVPILGEKHPVIWETGGTVFQELWEYIGPILTGVFESGEAVKRENELLPLIRQGFLEECYFTFSYSPLRDATGKVVGLLSTAVETTTEVISARRERLLQTLAAPVASAHPEEAVRAACRVLEGARDIPFHLVLVRGESGVLAPVASAHAELESKAAAPGQFLEGWPLSTGEIARVHLDELPGLVLDDETASRCTHAVLIPLPVGGIESDQGGVLVAGTAADLPWNEAYEGVLGRVGELVARHYDTHRLRTLLLSEAEDRYHQLFVQALDGIILGKPGGDIVAANPAACEILGYTEAELIAGGRALVQDDTDPRWSEGLRQRSATGAFFGELSFLHRSGRRIPCEVTSRTYRDSVEVDHSTVILRDVSERLMLQAQLAEAQKMEVVGRISGGIAHDFNNLLAVIDVQTDLLRDELSDRPGAMADLELLTQTSHRAAALIRRLLDFTRRSHGDPRAFNPSISITEMASLLRRMVGSGCELSFKLDEDAPDVVMAPHQFEQVVMNLVVNARDAVEETGRGGLIEVAVERAERGAFMRLVVRDEGVGIPETVRPDIFDAFYTTKAHGTGIGLNTVRLIVEGVGGSISVESTPGEGSTFTVLIPSGSATSPAEAPLEAEPTAFRLDDFRILLVEDQAHLRTVLTRVLKRAGADVISASNGEEALRLAATQPPDVLVTDVVMPLLSGPELVRRLRADRPDLAIVLMSGYAGDDIVPTELLDGARFLHKPFAAAALVRAVHEVMTGARSEA